MLRELEKAHPELALARQVEEIQEKALQVLIQGQSPAALKKQLKKFPAPQPLAGALARMLSLLGRLESEKELCLNAAGQLQAPPASLAGPLFIDCLEHISATARASWPEVPSPGEAVGWFWPVRPEPAGGPDLSPWRQHLDRLAELDLAVESTNRKIKLIDRINIFTDSPREVAAKEAKKVEQELSAAAGQAQENIRRVLLEGLQSFPAANLFYMCVELRTLCEGLRAVCCSETVTRGSGDDETTTTEYWCEVVGLDEACHQAVLCASTFHQYHGQVHGLYRQLTRLRMTQVQEPSLADVLRRLF